MEFSYNLLRIKSIKMSVEKMALSSTNNELRVIVVKRIRKKKGKKLFTLCSF